MSKSTTQKNQSVLEFTHEEARDYFLEAKSYCNFDLPSYFDFEPLLSKLHKKLNGKELFSFKKKNKKKLYDFKLQKINPNDFDDVNYKILDNKDGRYAWRARQLIHPALYVSLVHQITDKDHWETIRKRFKLFAKGKKIECISIPSKSLTKESNKAEQVSNWWEHFEQCSLELALVYKYLTHTDITDCYGSVYTHSVAWALHGKDFMKEGKNRRKNSLIGNIIDKHLQSMSHGQTNGIPHDSALMDFIAEMVLGYADLELLKKIRRDNRIKDYKILRYRDDYRIFTNNPSDEKHILKCLTEVMIDLGLKLSTEKTKSSSDVITSSIKSDKLYWIGQNKNDFSPQKRLLIIYELAKKYPNSGSVRVALYKFYVSLGSVKEFKKKVLPYENIRPLISIIVDIAYNNPIIYPYFATIISFLLECVSRKQQKEKILQQIVKKFGDIPNTAHLRIWLQRIAVSIGVDMGFKEKICKIVLDENINLWNNSWLKKNLRDQIETTSIIDKNIIKTLSPVISKEEVELFKSSKSKSY